MKNHSREMKPEKPIKQVLLQQLFQILYMVLDIDIISGRGFSNEVHHKLVEKRSIIKVMLYLPFISQ